MSAEQIKWGSVVMPSEGYSTIFLYWFREKADSLNDCCYNLKKKKTLLP
jgi:hypothetical protein